jgi:uncharacterized protein (TIGR03083 family)
MSSVAGQPVDEAVAEMVAVLTPHADADWQARAGSLEWSCWTTAAHVAHDLAAYAGQVAGRATAGYLPFDLVIQPGAPPREVLGVVEACGRLLSAAVAGAGTGPVAWHWGMSDADGFAAMGTAEVLVHTYDISQGLGVAWLPPEPLCQLVVDRLLPNSPPGRASEILLWATGRADLTGQSRVGEWVWRPGLSPLGVTIDDARAIVASLPRSYEALVRDRVKFRVGRIVYAAFSRDETIMGFGFPREEREALVASEPDKFLMPEPSDMRYQWVRVRLDALDVDELRELLIDAWRMCVPKKVAAEYEG